MAVFNTCTLLKRTIIQQISLAVDANCLTDLVKETTGFLQGTVPNIIKELFETYGLITPQSFSAAKAALETKVYQHASPIGHFFTSITEFANMAAAAESVLSASQLIDIGIIIITCTTVFASDVRKWHAKVEDWKTWPNFKKHFRTAQEEIKRSQPTVTTDSLGFHEQANNATSLVDQVVAQLTAQRDAETLIENEAAAERIAEQQMQQQLSEQANSTIQNQTMMDQMFTLLSTIATLQTQVKTQGNGG